MQDTLIIDTLNALCGPGFFPGLRLSEGRFTINRTSPWRRRARLGCRRGVTRPLCPPKCRPRVIRDGRVRLLSFVGVGLRARRKRLAGPAAFWVAGTAVIGLQLDCLAAGTVHRERLGPGSRLSLVLAWLVIGKELPELGRCCAAPCVRVMHTDARVSRDERWRDIDESDCLPVVFGRCLVVVRAQVACRESVVAFARRLEEDGSLPWSATHTRVSGRTCCTEFCPPRLRAFVGRLHFWSEDTHAVGSGVCLCCAGVPAPSTLRSHPLPPCCSSVECLPPSFRRVPGSG